jgi:hypothetical protein
MSFTITVPSALSGQLDNEEEDGNEKMFSQRIFEILKFRILILNLETQIIGDDEMNEYKDEFMKDIDFLPARQP